MKDHDLSLSSVGAVALSLLSGIILIAPGTVSAEPVNDDPKLDKQPNSQASSEDTVPAGKDAEPAGEGDIPAG